MQKSRNSSTVSWEPQPHAHSVRKPTQALLRLRRRVRQQLRHKLLQGALRQHNLIQLALPWHEHRGETGVWGPACTGSCTHS